MKVSNAIQYKNVLNNSNLIYLDDYINKDNKEKRIECRDKMQERLITGMKSNGVPVPTPSDPLRNRTDIEMIKEYLLTHGNGNVPARNLLMFRIGLATGLRISDIVRLKINHLMDTQGNFRERITVVETKTLKLNRIKITQAVRDAVMDFLSTTNWNYLENQQSHLITSWGKINNPALKAKDASEIFVELGKNMNLGIKIGSHTMRHTFAEIVIRYGDFSKFKIENLQIVQMLLNHSNMTTTRQYTTQVDALLDYNREIVSDFLTGRTEEDIIYTRS